MKRPVLAAALLLAAPAAAQVPPTSAEIAGYTGLHAASAAGNAAEIARLLEGGTPADPRDGHGRTPLHVAAHLRRYEAMKTLLGRGADANALDARRYDAITIAAVNDDAEAVRIALAGGNRAGNITSPYDGTALIAAAHLGHVEAVRVLIAAGAPLDHVNNLGWTALIEAIVLGDGGARHTETARLLIAAGADVNLPDRDRRTPLALARARGHTAQVALLQAAGAKE